MVAESFIVGLEFEVWLPEIRGAEVRRLKLKT
jgi:hypothetical protein